MIKIKGGTDAKNLKVFNISIDGVETEITGISSIYISEILPGGRIEAALSFIDVKLDILAEELERIP